MTVAVDPRGADLERFLAEDPSGPVVLLHLLRDPAYAAGTHLRTEALEEAVLQATVPW